jgi:predicted dienelactone hydrolase
MGGLYTPPSEQESLYWDQLLAWRASANYSWVETPSSLAGQFAAGPIAVVGHSMGGGGLAGSCLPASNSASALQHHMPHPVHVVSISPGPSSGLL